MDHSRNNGRGEARSKNCILVNLSLSKFIPDLDNNSIYCVLFVVIIGYFENFILYNVLTDFPPLGGEYGIAIGRHGTGF